MCGKSPCPKRANVLYAVSKRQLLEHTLVFRHLGQLNTMYPDVSQIAWATLKTSLWRCCQRFVF
jgi:hypothetical protein